MSKSKKPRNKKMSAEKKERIQQTQSNSFSSGNGWIVNNKVKAVNPVTNTKVFRGASRGS